MIFDIENIKQIINSPQMLRGINEYCFIMEMFEDDLNDDFFQKKYKNFYGMNRARLSPEFLEKYFEFMFKNKNNNDIEFLEVYEYINTLNNQRNPSFSSKLLHTINNEMPIYDRNVLRNLNIHEQNPIEGYKKICEWYNTFKDTDQASQWVEEFDKVFPNIIISKTKKIDFILWRL